MIALDWILLPVITLVSVPVLVLAAEIMAALWVGGKHTSRDAQSGNHGSLAVLIPAHDEAMSIAGTIKAVLAQIHSGDRIVVVADNCSDDTAIVARHAGAEVIERTSDVDKGKGFALAAGVAHLHHDSRDIVVILDADTLPEALSLRAIAESAIAQGHPMQAKYTLQSPRTSSLRTAISAFAFCMKNYVRLLGTQQLGIPCHLTGTGMALPWNILSKVNLATSNIVEDMQLGIDLALAGHAAQYCPAACISGVLPDQMTIAKNQRQRWEHGHLQTILRNVPRLLWQGLRQRRLGLIGMALDLAVPPLALLVCGWTLVTGLATVTALTGHSTLLPFWLALGTGAVLLGSILAAWARFARHILPLSSLLAVPFYILWKIPLYLAFAFRRQKAWIRTART